MYRLPILKVLQSVKSQGKKHTTFRWPNRKRSTEISKAIFFLQNPAVCLYFAFGKDGKRQISSIISAKWRSSFVIVDPDDVSEVCISRASAL